MTSYLLKQYIDYILMHITLLIKFNLKKPKYSDHE